jgi:hypothetical protein
VTCDQSVLFQLAQLLNQNLLHHVGQQALKFGKAPRLAEQMIQDHSLPPAGNNF